MDWNRIEGLTTEEVNRRVCCGQINEEDNKTKSIFSIIKEHLFTYFNLIFSILGILLAFVGAWKEMIFLIVVVINTVIGIVQEIHAKRILDRLNLITQKENQVIRDGKEQAIKRELLVKDDVIHLKAADIIPADAQLICGDIRVNEALLTGEADEIKKIELDELLSGSYVVSGQGYARLTNVGKDSYINQLTHKATEIVKEEKSKMIRSLDHLILAMGILMIPIGITLFIQAYYFNLHLLKDSITQMVAAVIGMIPEGLYLLTTVAMAASTIRLSRSKVVIHDMRCIESLARADVICVDKTGTITEDIMKVQGIHVLEGNEQDVIHRIGDFVANMENDNKTMEALKAYFVENTGEEAQERISFSPETKSSAVTFFDGQYILGAPELLIEKTYINGQEIIKRESDYGNRLLAFVKKEDNSKNQPLAFIIMQNPIRDGIKDTISYFQNHEIDLKVISGDHPRTVSNIAQKAGIKNAHLYVDASELTNAKDYLQAVEKYVVFGRVKPEQKQKLILAIKEQKKTVAMVGDGVNDVLALKNADCSIAMASGSEAACNVSQLVLLDSDFRKMPGIIAEGRRVVNNIERTAALYLVKNIFSILLAIFSMIFMLSYPLEPTQITLISLFTIGIPSVILALEPNQKPIKGNFLANIFIRALPAAITDFVVVSGLVIFCEEFQVGQDCLSTSCTILVSIVGFVILYHISLPMTKLHRIMIAGLILGFIFCVRNIRDFFSLDVLSQKCAMLMIIFALLIEPIMRYLRLFMEHFYSVLMSVKRRN